MRKSSIVRNYFVLPCCLLLLNLCIGLVGVWIAMMTDEWLRGLLMYRRWKKRRWVKYAERSRAHVADGADEMAPV